MNFSKMTGSQGMLYGFDPVAGGRLVRVDPGTGTVASQRFELLQWNNPHLVALADKVYVIDRLNGGTLHEVSGDTLHITRSGPGGDWPLPYVSAAGGENVFVIDGGEGGRLWRVSLSNLRNNGVGPEYDWPAPKLMTWLDGKLFVIDAGEGGRMWRVNPGTLRADGVGPVNDWPNPKKMTAVNGRIFVIEGSKLWGVDPVGLANNGQGPDDDWPHAKDIATDGNGLYICDFENSIWRIDQNTLERLELVGIGPGWTTTVAQSRDRNQLSRPTTGEARR